MNRLRALVLAPVLVFLATAVSAPAGAVGSVPEWETSDSTSAKFNPDKAGSISFFDAAGNPKTSGSINDRPFVKYAVSSESPGVYTKASLSFAGPSPAANIGVWPTLGVSPSSTFPPATNPLPASTNGKPIATLQGGVNPNIADALANFDQTGYPAGYAGVLQIRLTLSSIDAGQADKYATADVLVSGNTWTQIYPVTAPSSTTTLAATPASPSTVGDSVTLTATVTSSTPGTSLAGNVAFSVGATALGSAAVNTTTGTASISTTGLPAGSNTVTATFTPTDSAVLTGSSGTVTYVVSSPTTTTLTVTPTGTVTAGSSITLKATVSPVTAGSVTFLEGPDALAAPVAVNGSGEATLSVTPSSGAHSYKATFVPTSAAYRRSDSALLSVTVAAAKKNTALALALVPTSSVVGTSAVAKLTVTSVPAGTVVAGPARIQVKLGSKLIATTNATVAAGKANVTLPKTLARGKYTVAAQFLGSASLNASPVKTATLVVKAKAVVTAKLVAAAVKSTVAPKVSVALTAAGVKPVTGKVQVKVGTKVVATATLVRGSAVVSLPKQRKGTYKVTVLFLGSATVSPGVSKTLALKVS